jgi:hypothetical protein
VRAFQFDPKLESAQFQPLKLTCDLLVSKFAFKFIWYRYTTCLRRTAGAVGLYTR